MNNSKNIYFSALQTICCAFLLLTGPAVAETVYVTDILQLELFETMQMDGRPLKRLKSGDSMEVLQREGRYARVRLPEGETGWVKALYLIENEPARALLNKAEAEAQSARDKIAALEQSLAERDAKLESLLSTEEGAESQEAAMLAELEILRIENDDLQSRVNIYAGSVPMSWLLIGLFVTFVTGCISSWYYIDRRSRARHGGYRVY